MWVGTVHSLATASRTRAGIAVRYLLWPSGPPAEWRCRRPAAPMRRPRSFRSPGPPREACSQPTQQPGCGRPTTVRPSLPCGPRASCASYPGHQEASSPSRRPPPNCCRAWPRGLSARDGARFTIFRRVRITSRCFPAASNGKLQHRKETCLWPNPGKSHPEQPP